MSSRKAMEFLGLMILGLASANIGLAFQWKSNYDPKVLQPGGSLTLRWSYTLTDSEQRQARDFSLVMIEKERQIFSDQWQGLAVKIPFSGVRKKISHSSNIHLLQGDGAGLILYNASGQLQEITRYRCTFLSGFSAPKQVIMPNVRVTTVRLVDYIRPSAGRVEIFHQGHWGSICYDGWDIREAQVVCRMLGYPAAITAFFTRYYYGDLRIWLRNVRCQGNEMSITQCDHGPWGASNCSSRYARYAGVYCQPHPVSTPSPYRTTWRPYTNRPTWRPYTTRYPYTANPSPGYNPVRVVGGNSPSMGRVEILHNGQWGTVCDDSWGIDDARVVCRMLGYPSVYRALGSAYFGRGSGPIWLDEVGCSGNEPTISHCRHLPWGRHNCDHSEDAGVMCHNITGNNTIRLAGFGSSLLMGRVELLYNGQWGTVCDDEWDINDAHVVCRMLGNYTAARALTSAYFGSGRGRIWLDDVNCVGNESSITQCGHRGWGVNDCSHSEDAGVECRRPAPSTIRIITPTRYIRRGGTLYLYCSASGFPSPTVKWIRNNRTLTSRISSAYYGIYDIQFYHSGIYQCVASNKYGSASNTTSIYVLQGPRNTFVYFNVSQGAAMMGETVMMTCKTEAYPPPTCDVFRHGNRLGNSGYIIPIVTLSDLGSYDCRCNNSYGRGIGTGTLSLYEYPAIQTLFPREQNLSETNSFEIFCNATGNPLPKISWYINGKIKRPVGLGNTLSISNSSLDDEGTYTCTADNGRNRTTEHATVYMIYRVPRITNPPINATVDEDYNRSHDLHCNVTGNPMPNITWFKVGMHQLNPLGEGTMLTVFARWNYSGIYECVAENGIGGAARARAFYQVLHKPYSTKLKTNRDNNVVIGNAPVNIICTTIANPSVRHYDIYRGNKHIATSSSGLYVISKAKAEDQGTYSCFPRNTFGSGANATMELHVFGALSIISAPRNTTVLEGRRVTLYCNATSSLYKVHLPPIIRWRKIGEEDLHFPDGKKLTLEDIQPKDAGVYECEAKNGIALPDVARATVIVQYKPRNTKLTLSTGGVYIHLNDSISLVCKANAVPPASNFRFYHKGVEIGESSNGVLDVSQVSSSSNGTYSCVAKNSVGEGSTSSIILKFTSCGLRTFGSSAQSRIIGGDPSHHGGWPWQVQMAGIRYGSFFPHLCGASVVNEQWVVTAAHCVTQRYWGPLGYLITRPEHLNITVGEYNLSRIDGTEQQIPVEKVIVHRQYNTTTVDYDIALLKLKQPMVFNAHVSPVCLPTFDFPTNTACYVTGWGRTTMANHKSSIVLQEAVVPLMDRARCKALLQRINIVTSRMRCNGYNGYPKSTCHGDSGGPLVCKRNGRWFLMGITSWGYRNCADMRYPSVYADVLYFKDWIFNTIKENS